MSKRGSVFGGEHIEYTDPETGASVMQITNASVHSRGFYFEYPSFNTANDTMFFYTERYGGRGSPWDLYSGDATGGRIVQLSDEDFPLSNAYPVPDDARAIYGLRGNAIIRLNIDTMAEEEVGRCEEVESLSGLAISGDGSFLFSIGQLSTSTVESGKLDTLIVRMRSDGSETVTFGRNYARGHLTCNHAGTILHFRHAKEGPDQLGICDSNGDGYRPIGFQRFAHRCWLGTTDRLQGPLLPPGHGIVIADLDQEEPDLLCAGPYFWHSAASHDAQWIVSDTNWPNEGIMLVHVESGRFAPLTRPDGMPGSGQHTHPHPSFDRTGSRVVYTSNRGGLSQVYVATIPDELRDELETGGLTNRRRYWR